MKFISIANRKFTSKARSIPRASGDCMASRRSCIRHSRPALNLVSLFNAFCVTWWAEELVARQSTIPAAEIRSAI